MSNATIATIEQRRDEVANLRRRIIISKSINVHKTGQALEMEYELWQLGQISCRYVIFTIFASWIMISNAHLIAYTKWGTDLGTPCNTTSNETNSYWDNPDCITNEERIRIKITILVGSGVGALICGVSSDLIGRLLIYRIMLIIHVLSSLLIVIIKNAVLGYLCRFFICFTSCGMAIICLALLIEYSSRQTRAPFGILFFAYSAVGYAILGITMRFTDNWQYREGIWFLANEIILILTGLFLPESARLLSALNKNKKAWYYLRKVARLPIRTDVQDTQELTREDRIRANCNGLFETFRHWEFIKRLLCLTVPGILLNEVVVRFADYIFRDTIEKELYVYQILMAGIELLAISLGMPIYAVLGRKFTVILMFIAGCILYITYQMIKNKTDVMQNEFVVTILVTSRMLIHVADSGIMIMIAETFPTVCRCTVLAVYVFFDAIGAIIMLSLYSYVGRGYMAIVGAVCSFIAALLIIIVPPTRERYLVDTYEDAKLLQEKNNECTGYRSVIKCFKRS